MRPHPCSTYYSEAICEDERTVRLVRINIAVDACLSALLKIGADTERAVEYRAILCALADLLVLAHLHRK